MKEKLFDWMDINVAAFTSVAVILNNIDIGHILQLLALSATFVYTIFAIVEKYQKVKENRKNKNDGTTN